MRRGGCCCRRSGTGGGHGAGRGAGGRGRARRCRGCGARPGTVQRGGNGPLGARTPYSCPSLRRNGSPAPRGAVATPPSVAPLAPSRGAPALRPGLGCSCCLLGTTSTALPLASRVGAACLVQPVRIPYASPCVLHPRAVQDTAAAPGW